MVRKINLRRTLALLFAFVLVAGFMPVHALEQDEYPHEQCEASAAETETESSDPDPVKKSEPDPVEKSGLNPEGDSGDVTGSLPKDQPMPKTAETELGSEPSGIMATGFGVMLMATTESYDNDDLGMSELEKTQNTEDEIVITADSTYKVYDGTELTKSGFTTSELPADVTNVTAVVEGSQTDFGSSANVVTSYKLWNGTEDVTTFFQAATLMEGTLTVTKRPITITAASDSKPYDGDALENDGYNITTGTLAEDQTLDDVTVTGSQRSRAVATTWRAMRSSKMQPATM